MGVVFRYMSYDSVGSSTSSRSTNNGGGTTPSTTTATGGGGGNDGSSQGGRRRLNNNINFDRILTRPDAVKEFVNDRWKELRDKLAETMMMASSSSNNNNSICNKTSTATRRKNLWSFQLPDYTDETCRPQQQTILGQGEIKSLLYLNGYFLF